MHDFGKIVYLELQKTGSSFVCEFLKSACIHDERRHQKHMHVESDYRSDAIYFTSVRQPVMLYSSLYRFGLDKQGGIYKNLARANQLAVYASFHSFCELLLEPKNGPLLHPFYRPEIASEIGLASFRYLLLNLHSPLPKLDLCTQMKRPVSELMQDSIVSYVLKNESLNADLLRLSVELLPEHFDPRKAREFLDRATRNNQSSTPPESISTDSQALNSAIEARESLIMAHYR